MQRHTTPEGPSPQPELDEPRLADPDLTDLSKRDYFAVIVRAVREALDDNVTNLASAVAYNAFLAIPSALLVALGGFSLLAGPSATATEMPAAHLNTSIPSVCKPLSGAIASRKQPIYDKQREDGLHRETGPIDVKVRIVKGFGFCGFDRSKPVQSPKNDIGSNANCQKACQCCVIAPLLSDRDRAQSSQAQNDLNIADSQQQRDWSHDTSSKDKVDLTLSLEDVNTFFQLFGANGALPSAEAAASGARSAGRTGKALVFVVEAGAFAV